MGHKPGTFVIHDCLLNSSLRYHPLHNDDLGPQLLVDGEDVDETQCEHHEVQRQHRSPRLIRVFHHPVRITSYIRPVLNKFKSGPRSQFH